MIISIKKGLNFILIQAFIFILIKFYPIKFYIKREVLHFPYNILNIVVNTELENILNSIGSTYTILFTLFHHTFLCFLSYIH